MSERLNAEQQDLQAHNATLQVLYTADLIRSGAEYKFSDKLGRPALRLTDVQLENAYETGDPLLASAEQREERAREAWLSSDLEDIISTLGLEKLDAGHVRNRMPWAGLHTIRQVLAYGKEPLRIGRNELGPKMVDILQRYVDTNEFGITWKDFPDIDDVAELCRSLDEVPCIVLEPVNQDLHMHTRIINSRTLSVQQLLERTDEQKRKIIERRIHFEKPNGVVERSLAMYVQAQDYATQFRAAQIRLAGKQT